MRLEKFLARRGNRAIGKPRAQFRLAARPAWHSDTKVPAEGRACRLRSTVLPGGLWSRRDVRAENDRRCRTLGAPKLARQNPSGEPDSISVGAYLNTLATLHRKRKAYIPFLLPIQDINRCLRDLFVLRRQDTADANCADHFAVRHNRQTALQRRDAFDCQEHLTPAG